jgi:hypothetical protein
MDSTKSIQLSQLIDGSQPKNIFREVRKTFLYHYPRKYFSKIRKYYKYSDLLFRGKIPGYKACNTFYHDFNHTLLTLLACARLLDGYNLKENAMPPTLAVNLLSAALFHDVGYIQEDWDKEGTGAKFTKYHVQRSIEFLDKNQERLKMKSEDRILIQKFIQCTGLTSEIYTTEFNSDLEKLTGAILGTADLLGQMSDRAYIEKLYLLYHEFQEAGVEDYTTEFDLIRKTVAFYGIIKEKFSMSFMNTYLYAQTHFKKRFGIDKNLYLECIDRHIAYIRNIIEDSSTNFRAKLQRASWLDVYVHP